MILHKTDINTSWKKTNIKDTYWQRKRKKKTFESIPAACSNNRLLYKRGKCASENSVTLKSPSIHHSSALLLRFPSSALWRLVPRCDGPLAQPGRGDPLWLSVQFIYQSAQLVESLAGIRVQDGRVEEVAKVVLHFTGLFNNLLQLLRLWAGNRTWCKKVRWQCLCWILKLTVCMVVLKAASPPLIPVKRLSCLTK